MMARTNVNKTPVCYSSVSLSDALSSAFVFPFTATSSVSKIRVAPPTRMKDYLCSNWKLLKQSQVLLNIQHKNPVWAEKFQ